MNGTVSDEHTAYSSSGVIPFPKSDPRLRLTPWLADVPYLHSNEAMFSLSKLFLSLPAPPQSAVQGGLTSRSYSAESSAIAVFRMFQDSLQVSPRRAVLALWLWAHSHDRGPSTHKAKIRVCDVPFTARSHLSYVRPTKLQPSAEHAPPSFPIPSTFVGPPSYLWQFGVKTRSSPKLSGTSTSRRRRTAVPVLFCSRSR